MTDTRHLCSCGKPIHDGAHLCHACIGAMRTNLRTIAERWDDLETALIAPAAAPLHLVPPEHGDRDNTGNATGIDLSEAVVKARTMATELVWFMVQVIRDDYDDLHTIAVEAFEQAARELAHRELWEDGVPEILGRLSAAIERTTLHLPKDQSVPNLALWLERWHLTHLVTKGAEDTAQEIADDIHKTEKATFDALNVTRVVHVGIPCVEHGTSDLGERVPCAGHMTARAAANVMPDLVCSEDRSHKIAQDKWQRDGWRGRFAKPLDAAGLKALAAKVLS